MYRKVAEQFASKLNVLFDSEATLKAEFESNFPGLPFNRTDHWQGIFHKLMREAWYVAGPEVKAEPTGYDKGQILKELHTLLDYNLFSQVLLNLQNYSMAYRQTDAQKDIESLRAEWAGLCKRVKSSLDPFAPKAKMLKTASTEDEKQFNMVVSTLRSLKIIAAITPMVSFRVTPKGATPAFADSNNLSMLGIGADDYLTVSSGCAAFYLCWAPGSAPQMITPVTGDVPAFRTEGIPYTFISKSGGEVLNEVLFARKIMCNIFAGVTGQLTMVPRMNSILIVTRPYTAELGQVFEILKAQYPALDMKEGSRIRLDVGAEKKEKQL